MNGFSGGVPISTHLVPVPARIPALARRRPHSLLMIVIAAIIVLALGASGAGGVLLAMHAKAPATTGTRSATAPATSAPTAGPGALPTATAENASTVASIGGGQPTVAPAAPVPTAVPTPTATPLLTPTIVVSSSPLQATPSTTPKNCFATQKLTNISSVDAHWSWSNTPPTGGGWQYSTVSLTTGYSGTPPTITTPPQSSIYVYIKAPLTDLSCTEYNNVVATITVTGGNGTQFSVKY